MEKERVTTKIYRSSLDQLRVIAAIKRESQPETLERLLAAEYEQVRKEFVRETPGLQGRTRSD